MSLTKKLSAAMLASSLVLVVLMCSLEQSSSSSSGSSMVEARYLPTRSDQSLEIETLRDIIRNLLQESSGLAPGNRGQQKRSSLLYEAPARDSFLQRRAAEMSVSSSNGDESTGYLLGPYDTPNTGSQLYKQQVASTTHKAAADR